MSQAVVINEGGKEQQLPLALLDLPPGYSDADLKKAVAELLGMDPAAFSQHVVVRDGERLALRHSTAETDPFVARFVVWAVTFLLVGTVQGVVQVTPNVRRWIMSTGGAGHLIDPLAHAHVNLVGGVVMAVMALAYYVLPRVLARPVRSVRLVRLSLWGMAVGVSAWYLSMVLLGLAEGNLMLREGIGFYEAKDAMQPWHTLGFMVPATIMGIGHWLFIVNIYVTVFRKPRA